MNKYSLVFKTSFKQQRVTAFDTFLRAISYALIMFIFVQLWSYIYGDGGVNKVINGYSLKQMLWYLVVTESIQCSVRASSIVKSIGKEIKTGSVAYKMNKPYNYYLYTIVSHMADSVWKSLFMIPTGLLMGFILIGSVESFTIYQVIPSILILICSQVLMWAMHGIIGLISFWVEDAEPFNWIAIKFFMLFGLFFPLEFFPKVIQVFISYSPIYSVYSGPAKLIANFSWNLFFKVIVSQAVWIVILISLGLFIYKKGKKKVNVNGG